MPGCILMLAHVLVDIFQANFENKNERGMMAMDGSRDRYPFVLEETHFLLPQIPIITETILKIHREDLMVQ